MTTAESKDSCASGRGGQYIHGDEGEEGDFKMTTTPVEEIKVVVLGKELASDEWMEKSIHLTTFTGKGRGYVAESDLMAGQVMMRVRCLEWSATSPIGVIEKLLRDTVPISPVSRLMLQRWDDLFPADPGPQALKKYDEAVPAIQAMLTRLGTATREQWRTDWAISGSDELADESLKPPAYATPLQDKLGHAQITREAEGRSSSEAEGRSSTELLQPWVDHVARLLNKLDRNAFTRGLAPLAALTNHACFPNCTLTFEPCAEDPLYQICTVRTCDAIKSGEELTISYLSAARWRLPTRRRQRLLKSLWGFTCHCARCTGATHEHQELERLL